jgi:energy-coupling factor transport system substrate-specific component
MSIEQQKIRNMTLIAICAAILFVQQIALSFLPNIQFTTLLVIIYTKVLGFKKTSMIVVVHVLAIGFFSPTGTLNPIYLPAMLIGWLLIPILLSTVFKKMNQAFSLSLFALVFGFVYGWIFIPFSVFFLNVPFLEYFLMDLPFEIIMAVNNFITVLWLYDILKKVLVQLKQNYDGIALTNRS